MDSNTPEKMFESPAPPGLDIQQMLMSIMEAQVQLTSSMGSLKEEVDKLKLNTNTPEPLEPKYSKVKDKVLSSVKNKDFQRAQSAPLPSKTPTKQNSKPSKVQQKLPQKSSLFKTESPKRHPLQLQEKDVSPEFKGVKVCEYNYLYEYGFTYTYLCIQEAFYAHIKLLWNITEKDSLPCPPSEDDLVSFYRKFSNTAQIEEALQDQSSLEINGEEDLHAFAKKQLQAVNLSRGLNKISKTYMDFMQGSLARLGFTIGSPNLAQNHDNLYNFACRIFCVTTFQQLAVAGAYNNYSINFPYIMKTALLQRAYDHFVHYWMKAYCDKEVTAPGSSKEGKAKGLSNKN
ncbi:hypothetical protein O181_085283 [Austropuccinia psidii MF-1]|uniref:Uncharacterized protein n=1 Tax=Austropuccinia psidii MF-1 TaxID=1389203 RepID=A0A9Q3FSU7_9BASI|nr:hypothetical protein [Austropuccinia psidii MF-1]